MIPDPSPPYEFSSIGQAKRATALARAGQIGLRAEVDRWFKLMDVELRYHPRTWGDPIRNFAALQQVLFRGWAGPLMAHYTLHDRLPMVVLVDVAVRPDHPLARNG